MKSVRHDGIDAALSFNQGVKAMKCAHELCNCVAAAGKKYCSNECESDTRDEGATECHCGHQECRESHGRDRDSTRN